VKQKKDRSMLYAVLAGACGFALLVCVWSWLTRNYNAPNTIYPSGSVISEIDTFGGFPAYGIDMEIVQIPTDQSDEFTRQLQEKGLKETPLPEDLHYTLASDPDTRMLSEISNGLWWFRNDSAFEDDGGMLAGRYTNFTFTIYDIDACVYYHMKYVF